MLIQVKKEDKKPKKNPRRQLKHLAVCYRPFIFKISVLLLCDCRFVLQHLKLAALLLFSRVLVPGLQCHRTSCHNSTTKLKDLYTHNWNLLRTSSYLVKLCLQWSRMNAIQSFNPLYCANISTSKQIYFEKSPIPVQNFLQLELQV